MEQPVRSIRDRGSRRHFMPRAEWNGAYRDCVRRFWRGDAGQVPELASCLTGSSDIYAPSGRRTYASMNYVASHDGFTLTDLVSYEERQNWANGENNQDGPTEGFTRNWGAEGPTDSLRIKRMRERQAQHARHPLLLAGRQDDPAGRRIRPDAAGQQQRVLPRQRDQLAEQGIRRGGLGAPRVHQRARPDPLVQPDPAPPGATSTAGPSRRGARRT